LYTDEIGKNAADIQNQITYKCRGHLNLLEAGDISKCYQSKPGNDLSLMLVGDSHAGHLFSGFSEIYGNENIGLLTFNAPHMDQITKAILETNGIKSVAFSLYWLDKLAPDSNSKQVISSLRDSITKISNADINVYII